MVAPSSVWEISGVILFAEVSGGNAGPPVGPKKVEVGKVSAEVVSTAGSFWLIKVTADVSLTGNWVTLTVLRLVILVEIAPVDDVFVI